MKARDRGHLDGMLATLVAVAEITGPMPIDGMDNQTWKMICKITERLAELASIEARRLDAAR